MIDINNLSPEEKDQIIAALLGGGADHPDQAQDQAMLNQQIQPVLELILDRLNALEGIVEKIVTGAYGAVQARDRGNLLDTLRSAHGETLGPLSGVYSKLVGNDPFDDIADEIMRQRDSEGYAGDDSKIAELIDAIKNKFGGIRYEEPAAPADLEVQVEKTEPPETTPEMAPGTKPALSNKEQDRLRSVFAALK